MNWHNLRRDPELEALLATGKEIPQIPEIVRARALSRAQKSLHNAAVATPTHTARRRALALAFAASTVFIVGVAGAVVAMRTFAPPPAPPAQPASPRVSPPAALVPPPAPPAPSTALPLEPAPVKRVARATRPALATESYAAELELLQRAQAAYAGRSFTDALTVVAEHRRRFPNGRLAEEREALRVRALNDAGRTHESRAAATAFAERFPRSVLLPRLSPQSK